VSHDEQTIDFLREAIQRERSRGRFAIVFELQRRLNVVRTRRCRSSASSRREHVASLVAEALTSIGPRSSRDSTGSAA